MSFTRFLDVSQFHLRKKGAIFDIVEKEWVLHVPRLILGGDGF